jgi:hypothetical protein
VKGEDEGAFDVLQVGSVHGGSVQAAPMQSGTLEAHVAGALAFSWRRSSLVGTSLRSVVGTRGEKEDGEMQRVATKAAGDARRSEPALCSSPLPLHARMLL